jgi:phage shock protein PspC (stress-responsive transcriptional regulator)
MSEPIINQRSKVMNELSNSEIELVSGGLSLADMAKAVGHFVAGVCEGIGSDFGGSGLSPM